MLETLRVLLRLELTRVLILERIAKKPTGSSAVGSGLVDHSQKMTVAARATAEKETLGRRS